MIINAFHFFLTTAQCHLPYSKMFYILLFFERETASGKLFCTSGWLSGSSLSSWDTPSPSSRAFPLPHCSVWRCGQLEKQEQSKDEGQVQVPRVESPRHLAKNHCRVGPLPESDLSSPSKSLVKQTGCLDLSP